MKIDSLKIRNFRNIKNLSFTPDALIQYLYAPNGTGKTNILEALQCLSIGKSLKASSEQEIVPFRCAEDNTPKDVYIFGSIEDEENLTFTQTFFVETTFSNEQKSTKKSKTLLINKTKTPFTKYLGNVPTIWFSPESIKIITSSPRSKREYFDNVLIQLYPLYHTALKNYHKALKQRNALLQDDFFRPNLMRVWTEQLVEYGAKVIQIRKEFFEILNQTLLELGTIERYTFQIKFEPNILIHDIFNEDAGFKYREALRSSYVQDKRRGLTGHGPHKDDWHMLISIAQDHMQDFIRADKFASRGQQRMSLVLLQLALIKLFEKKLFKKPVLLLDDIFSELDDQNSRILMDVIQSNTIQSFITGVEKRNYRNIEEHDVTKLIQ